MGGEDPSSRPAYPYSVSRVLGSSRKGHVRCQAPIPNRYDKRTAVPRVRPCASVFGTSLVTGPGPGRGLKSESRGALGVRGLVGRVDAARDDAVPGLARGRLPAVLRDVGGEEVVARLVGAGVAFEDDHLAHELELDADGRA